MRCVSYTRVTSCSEVDAAPANIISQQNERILAYMKAAGWKLEEKYADRKNDPNADDAFQRLRQDGIARKFDMVVVDSIFRCGKNVSFAEDILLKVFFQVGIHFAVVEDDLCSIGKSYEELHQYIVKKRNYYVTSSTRKFVVQQYQSGFYTIGDERYGHILSSDMKTLTVDEEAARVIREIFRRVGQGESCQKIAADLNAREVESPTSRMARLYRRTYMKIDPLWTKSSVYRIHHVTAYLGSYTKTVQGKRIEVKCPQILSKAEYEEYRTSPMRKSCPPHPRISKPNILAKKVFNGATGKIMYCRTHADLPGSPRMYHITADPSSKGLAYEKVAEAVQAEIGRECQLASLILEKIKTGKMEVYREARRAELVQRGKMLCEQISREAAADVRLFLEYEAGALSEKGYREEKQKASGKISSFEHQFEEVMRQADRLDKLYSAQNPWLQQCLQEKLTGELQKRQADTWVEKVEIYNLSEIRVFLKQAEWKALFPKEIVEG